MKDEAIKKLLEQAVKGTFGSKAMIMKDAVCRALTDFCRQDGEFARAVVQGGSFSECMAAVEKAATGSGISDEDAYAEAVRFYFPGAGIVMQMRIDLCASVRDGDAASPDTGDSIILDLADFL